MRILIPFVVVAILHGSGTATVAHAKGNSLSDTLARDTVIIVDALPVEGFNFPYVLYLPKGMKMSGETTLMVETNNGGLNDTLEHHKKTAIHTASKSGVANYVARRLKIPLLVPVFPRSATHWTVYTHALDRDAFLSTDSAIRRLDLQLIAMVESARKLLRNSDVRLDEQFFITGFSASGTFANRFSLLHPGLLKATASGGINAIAILPVSHIEGTPFKFPLGIADVGQVTGRKVQMDAFKKLPKMLYMGALDDNDAAAFDDAYDEEERQQIYKFMGRKSMPDRWAFMRDIYKQHGIEATFITYPHIGHGTDLRINNELVAYFRKYLQDK